VEYSEERGARPVLCFYFHPWEFIEMPSEFSFGEGTVKPDPFLLENCGDYALQQFDELVGNMKNEGCEFYSARGLAEAWD
jgi:hypothetical protein